MKKKQIKATIATAVLGILSPLAMVVPASATTVTWAGHHPIGSYDGLASTGSNWVGGVAPVSGDSVVFSVDGINQTIDLDLEHTTGAMSLASIVFNGAKSGTSSKDYALSSDNTIKLSGNIESIMTGTGGNHSIDANVTLETDSTFKTSGSSALTVGGSATTLNLGAKTLTLDASGGSVTIQGKITGTGNLVKSGSGKVNVLTTPSTDGFSGGIALPSGEIVATGTLGAITISGGTLRGTGTVGAVTMSSGIVAPGASPGVLNSGSLAFTGGKHEVELGGFNDGEFDQLVVTGAVDLGSATDLSISLYGGYAPELEDSFVIIDNDGEDAVSGTFKGLKEGAKVFGAYTYQITYEGGDGNDVVLTVTGNPGAPDTGAGSLVSSPIATFFVAIMAGSLVAGYRIYELKKVKR